jgi:hypothetical protein
MPAKPVYVTKQQLDEALAAQDQRFDAKLVAQDQRLDAKLVAQDQRLDARLAAMEERLGAQLASHLLAFQEWLATLIKVVDEKYADLPGRVAALEARSTP